LKYSIAFLSLYIGFYMIITLVWRWLEQATLKCVTPDMIDSYVTMAVCYLLAFVIVSPLEKKNRKKEDGNGEETK
jgi:uncharacterized membrane protein (DUF485 family)